MRKPISKEAIEAQANFVRVALEPTEQDINMEELSGLLQNIREMEIEWGFLSLKDKSRLRQCDDLKTMIANIAASALELEVLVCGEAVR